MPDIIEETADLAVYARVAVNIEMQAVGSVLHAET